MKNFLFVFSLIFLSFQSFSQDDNEIRYFINDVPIDSIDVEYVRIVGTSKLLSNKVSIELEFGQYKKFFGYTETRVVDNTGKKVDFNSIIDALNFMYNHGYEYLNAYAITINNQNVYHYLMKRKKS